MHPRQSKKEGLPIRSEPHCLALLPVLPITTTTHRNSFEGVCTPVFEVSANDAPPDYFVFDSPTRQQLGQRAEPAGAQGRVAYAHFGVAPLTPEPGLVGAWWQQRSRRQKAVLIASATAAGAALVTGLAAGLSIAAERRRTATAGSFFSTFSADEWTQWNISDARANGASYRCGFTRAAVAIADNALQLSIVDGAVAGKPLGCGQLLRDGLFGYGIFSSQMQPLSAPGVVTAMFLYTETQNGINQEIDLQFMGNDTRTLSATAYRDAKPTTQLINLGFDAAVAPHSYSIDWQKDAIKWLVDGSEVFRLDKDLPRYARQSLYVTTWLAEPGPTAGNYNTNAPRPSGASRFDWVRYQH